MSLSSSQKRWGAGLAVFLLAAIGMVGAYRAAKSHRHAEIAASRDVTVTVTATACEPNELTVPAGKVTFRIVNGSARVLEWEILKGVIVVEERENIAPGFTQSLTATLQAGDYDVTCGLLGNPRGKLTVIESRGTTAPHPVKPTMVELIGPTAEYKVYVSNEADELVAATQELTDAVKAGDLAKAQALYGPAHVRYGHIAPVAALFDDLDKAIDSRADDHARKEEDPDFTGFHRVEDGLFAKDSTVGLLPFADRLNADVIALKDRIPTLSILPDKMAEGAATLVGDMAAGGCSGPKKDSADLSDCPANLEGVRKIVTLLHPLTERAAPELSRSLDAHLAATSADLARDTGPADREALREHLTVLAGDLSKLPETLGLK